jgi:hypothetical protein
MLTSHIWVKFCERDIPRLRDRGKCKLKRIGMSIKILLFSQPKKVLLDGINRIIYIFLDPESENLSLTLLLKGHRGSYFWSCPSVRHHHLYLTPR